VNYGINHQNSIIDSPDIVLRFVIYQFLKFNIMNTIEKQGSNELEDKKYLNTEDDFLNPKDPEEDEEEDVDDEDLEEEAENPVDSPGNDFNEIEEEIEEEDEDEEENETSVS
jgi:hypothetical protein